MELFAGLRTFSFGAIALRLIGALICGAAIGLDREMRNKKAGLKTHVLVCLGAALCMIVFCVDAALCTAVFCAVCVVWRAVFCTVCALWMAAFCVACALWMTGFCGGWP